MSDFILDSALPYLFLLSGISLVLFMTMILLRVRSVEAKLIRMLQIFEEPS